MRPPTPPTEADHEVMSLFEQENELKEDLRSLATSARRLDSILLSTVDHIYQSFSKKWILGAHLRDLCRFKHSNPVILELLDRISKVPLHDLYSIPMNKKMLMKCLKVLELLVYNHINLTLFKEHDGLDTVMRLILALNTSTTKYLQVD